MVYDNTVINQQTKHINADMYIDGIVVHILKTEIGFFATMVKEVSISTPYQNTSINIMGKSMTNENVKLFPKIHLPFKIVCLHISLQ